MSQNLHDAHRQWAVRPPDERFPSLETLYGVLNARRRASEEETSQQESWDKKSLVLPIEFS